MISKSQITAWISFSPFPPLSSPTAGGRCRRRNPSLPTRSPVGITANAGKSDLLLRLRGGVGVAWLSHETELRENYNRCLTGYRLHSVQNESVKVKARMRACSVKQSAGGEDEDVFCVDEDRKWDDEWLLSAAAGGLSSSVFLSALVFLMDRSSSKFRQSVLALLVSSRILCMRRLAVAKYPTIPEQSLN